MINSAASKKPSWSFLGDAAEVELGQYHGLIRRLDLHVDVLRSARVEPRDDCRQPVAPLVVRELVTVAKDAVDAIADAPIILPDGTELTVTISAGLAAWVPSKRSREESLAFTYEAADKALYEAKESGRRRLCVYDPAANVKAA